MGSEGGEQVLQVLGNDCTRIQGVLRTEAIAADIESDSSPSASGGSDPAVASSSSAFANLLAARPPFGFDEVVPFDYYHVRSIVPYKQYPQRHCLGYRGAG
jgi:hypothetical protein